jgi:glycosyltransferase involved in cell wall biosynthesis
MTKVSVIIPARNEEEHIRGCLDSLMNQTKKPFEVIVVTNNSTDKTEEIVNGYKRRGIKQIVFRGKSSAAIARNMGAKIAKGDVLFFLDADIVSSSALIEEIYNVFSDPEVMHALTPSSANVNTFIQKCYKAKMSYIQQKRVKEGTTKKGVNITRKGLFRKIGGYPEDVFYFEDRVLWEGVKNYKQGVIKSLVYHNDPGSLNEFIRQSKYLGKGLSTYEFRRLLHDNRALRMLAKAFLLISILAIIMLLFASDKTRFIELVILVSVGMIIVYGVIRLLLYSIYSKMPIESFAWVFILMPIRFSYVSIEYLRNKLRGHF